MAQPRHVLVFRFSALGDVAMTIPVIRQLLDQHPDLRVTFVSNKAFKALFEGIDRLQFHEAGIHDEHQGLTGLYKLYRQLKRTYRFDAIADLHQVLRTKAIKTFFTFSGIPVATIDKGRDEKALMTRKENKILKPLTDTFERYAAVFRQLGLDISLDRGYIPMQKNIEGAGQLAELKRSRQKLVGVGPFAKHAEKVYPPLKLQQVIRKLAEDPSVSLFFFGGPDEAELLDQWENEIPRTRNLAGKMDLATQMKHISWLDLMVSMDSANMHLASLFGIPVVSIWGSTHPYAGFYGWGQHPGNAVQVDLFCRPCSVFGNKPCYRGNLECLHAIEADSVYGKIREVLARQS